MRKQFKANTWFFPLPVLIVAAYDENGNPNAMNAAWGGIYDTNTVYLCLSAGHKTTKDIIASKAFTISFGTEKEVEACDYVGIVSGNKVADKVKNAGWTTTKAESVNAPIIDQLPFSLECELEKVNEDGIIIGSIKKISVDEEYLDKEGKPDVEKMNFISFDPVDNTYLKVHKKVGKAFSDGKKLEK